MQFKLSIAFEGFRHRERTKRRYFDQWHRHCLLLMKSSHAIVIIIQLQQQQRQCAPTSDRRWHTKSGRAVLNTLHSLYAVCSMTADCRWSTLQSITELI